MKDRDRLLRDVLEKIDSTITAVTGLAFVDFKTVVELLKSVNSGQQIKAGLDSFILQSLQYHDSYSQKMEHIMQVHQLINEAFDYAETFTRENSLPNNLIRLNHLQFQASSFQYFTTVNHIQQILERHKLGELHRVRCDQALFQHTNEIMLKSQRICECFAEAETLCCGLDVVKLMPHYRHVECLYSMESERAILKAYLDRPDIKDKDINLNQAESDNSSIELF